MVVLGNAYGRSSEGVDSVYLVLNKLDKTAWNYYLNNCLQFDWDVLEKIKAGDHRTSYWCMFVNQYNLNEMDIQDRDMQKMLMYSAKNDKNNTKAIAGQYLKKLLYNS